MTFLHNTDSDCKSLVFVRDGEVLANSRDVAETFGKRHADVLRAIDDLDCSPDFRQRNFALTSDTTKVGAAVRTICSYDLTKDGFAFLVMGFTGSTAARFKEAYIAAFNAMEVELRERDEDGTGIIPFTPESEARLLVGQAQRTFGPKAAQQLWGLLGLPVVPAMLIPSPQMEMSFTATIAPANQNHRLAADRVLKAKPRSRHRPSD